MSATVLKPVLAFTSCNSPEDPRLLHQIFEAQVAKRPHHPAIECNGRILTYRKLDALANRIAHWLKARGIGPGSLVGVCSEKSCEVFAAILGVLKAGGAYVPIDPTYPLERMRSIIEDAGITIVVSAGDLGAQLKLLESTTVLLLDRDRRRIARQSKRALRGADPGATPVDICYVIYTSGSTGRPKGVVVEHRNAANFVRSLSTVYGIQPHDRIYQGFSLAFDASVEEIWAALSLGGTLVVAPQSVARSPLDVAEFLTNRQITYFSTVPTFLAVINAELPTVRTIVVGGEPCLPELVLRWAPGRRMLNTYGPTEATVVATAAECIAGEPVTIGTALPGYTTHVLDENLQPVRPGEVGELMIGGLSIARGYLKRPELTSERFIPDPFDRSTTPTRLYRTHDCVRVTENGALQFLGRNDDLVKIRGFRVELSEIEAVLIEHPSVRAAAATTMRHGEVMELAAYVVPVSGANAVNREEIAALLRKRLPDYMLPRYLEMVYELPATTSGKIDRKLLPAPKTLLSNEAREAASPSTPLEAAIVKAFEKCFQISPIFATDDFFRDLNGHSLIAARVITELRTALGCTRISVRDLYEHRTACHLANHLQSVGIGANDGAAAPPEGMAERALARPLPLLGRWLCALAQAIGVVALHGVTVAPIVLLTGIAVDAIHGRVELWRALNNAYQIGFLIWPSWLGLSIAIKWIVIGRYQPGRYRVWGLYYLRWWIVSRFQSLSWSYMFIGTPLMSLYYRAMGAKVGVDSTICTPLCTAFDLVAIGEGTSIGADTQLLGYRVENGWLILGHVQIGDDCFVGMHCSLGLNVTMGNRARLDDMSLIPDHGAIAAGEFRNGSPSALANVKVPGVLAPGKKRRPGFVFGLIHLVLIYAMGYLLILGAMPGAALALYALLVGGPLLSAASVLLAVPLCGLSWLLIVLIVKRAVIGRIRPGLYPLASRAYLKIWFLSYLLSNTRELVLPVYATMLMPRLLRLLGAKIGPGVEISTVMHVMPDLLEIGEGSFLADACIVGGLRIHRGWVEVLPNKIGARTFVGNSALTPPGVDLGNNGLIGLMSKPPADQPRSPDGTRWLGSPSFELPNTQAAVEFDEKRTYSPTIWLILLRSAMESLRILLPSFIVAAEMVAFIALLVVAYDSLPTVWLLLAASCLSVGLALAAIVLTAIAKRLLIGSFLPEIRPLWCAYVWANEVVNGVYESVAAHAMTPLLGTPFIAPCLRLLGCRIGRWVFLETTLFSEFDLVRIGDRAALNLGTTIQTHLFEDRVMKADNLEIGEDCSLGNMSVILYGAKMERGSSLGALSLLMKGETLPAFSRWHGVPCEPVRKKAVDIAQSRPQVPEAA